MLLCSRKSAVRLIFRKVKDEAVILSTGMISREAYQDNDRPRNFYMQGSMGMALAIGLGIAYQKPHLKVIVISGDGAALMSLGTLALHRQMAEKGMANLMHYILDNECHASTGGQPTCSGEIDFTRIGPYRYTKEIKVSDEKGEAPRIPMSCKEIKERFKHALIHKQKQ